MNNRNEIITDRAEIREYIDKMVKNARKHGILIQSVICNAPMANHTYRKVITDNLRSYSDIRSLIEDVDYLHRTLHDALDRSQEMEEILKKAIKLAKGETDNE